MTSSQSDPEKVVSTPAVALVEENSEEDIEKHGYALDAAALGNTGNLKLASDGHTILIPQPSSDPYDPLNWSQHKKHLILFIISACAFLPDYGSVTGNVVLLTQSKAFNVSVTTLTHASTGNQFMIGAGGPIAVGLSAYFGRLPVLFWWMLVAVATSAGDAGAQSFKGYMTSRIINGFFSTVAQGGGLMFIRDMFFVHEQVRKINLWQSSVIVSPFVGPLFAAFMISKLAWYWPFIVYTIETTVCFILVVLFVEETYYDRSIPTSERPQRGARWERLFGIAQRRTKQPSNTFFQAMMRPVTAISKPVILITNIYYLLTFCWAVGINTTLSQFLVNSYNFTTNGIGYFYFIPIVSTIMGEVAGHWIHDALARASMRRQHGRLEPEARLQVIWVAEPFLITGLVVIGFGLEKHWSYWVPGIGLGMFSFGIMLCSVGVNAYNLDAYPEGSGEVAAWINFSRTTGGFIVSYFNVQWASSQGPRKCFGTQAGVQAAVFLLVIALQIWGKRLRLWAGPMRFKTG